MSSVVLEADGVVVDHLVGRPPFRRALRAVHQVSLRVETGERVAIVGPSGCGKTSLIRALCGLYPITSGRCLLLGVNPDIAKRPPPGVQLLLQDAAASLHPAQTVRETVSESARLFCPSSPDAVASVLEATGLSHRAEAYPKALSGGEKRRVGLAKLLLARPKLIFADEPTAGLDAARKADLLELLLTRQGPDATLILVTHDLAVAKFACTRIVHMDGGKILSDQQLPGHERIGQTDPGIPA